MYLCHLNRTSGHFFQSRLFRWRALALLNGWFGFIGST